MKVCNLSLFSVFQSYDRVGAADILPNFATVKAEIFIKKMDETIQWYIFVDSLSTNSWLLIIIVAIVVSLSLSLVEGLLNHREQVSFLPSYWGNVWIAFKANFGGAPGSIITRNSYRIIIFVCLLVGSIVWMAYQGSLTSKLAVIQQTYPFKNLQGLSESNYE